MELISSSTALYGLVLVLLILCVCLLFFGQLGAAMFSAQKSKHNPKHADFVPPTHPLATSASDFSRCLLPGGDIDMYKFERACNFFADEVLDRINDFGSRMDAYGMRCNIDRLRTSIAQSELDKGMPPGRSMRMHFDFERSRKIHSAGGVIADQSAAMGVLWLRFGLQTWLNFLTLCCAASEGVEGGTLMEQAAEASHGDVLGWWSRSTGALTHRAMGRWETVAQCIGPSVGETEKDAKRWCACVQELIIALKALQREFGYEDKRVSA